MLHTGTDKKILFVFNGNIPIYNIYHSTVLYRVHFIMCTNNRNKILTKVLKLLVNQLNRVLCCILRRILSLTVHNLALIIVICASVFIIANWKRDEDNFVNRRTEKPFILWWKSGFPGTSEVKHCSRGVQCTVSSNVNDTDFVSIDAFLFYASDIDFEDLPFPRRQETIIWGLFHEESPRNVEVLLHEEALRLFNFSATFSRNSNIPFPLQHLGSKQDITKKHYYVPTYKKNIYLKEISPVMYLQTDCETSTERDAYVKELMNYINVDSYGGCLKNKEMPEELVKDYLNNLNEDSFLKFIARYKFIIAIENGVCHDYVTEKFWRAIKVGSVPIYFGSPSIKDWFPNDKSAILLQDFPTPKLMADHLIMLSSNDTLYEEYLEHKTKEIITNAELLRQLREREYQLDTLRVVHKFECLVCEQLHSIREGNFIVNIVNRSHYDCPQPLSALTLSVNPYNSWVSSWQMAKSKAKDIYAKVMNS